MADPGEWPRSVLPLDAGELSAVATEGRVLICEGCGEAEAVLECEGCGDHLCHQCWGDGDDFCEACLEEGPQGRPVANVQVGGDFL